MGDEHVCGTIWKRERQERICRLIWSGRGGSVLELGDAVRRRKISAQPTGWIPVDGLIIVKLITTIERLKTAVYLVVLIIPLYTVLLGVCVFVCDNAH